VVCGVTLVYMYVAALRSHISPMSNGMSMVALLPFPSLWLMFCVVRARHDSTPAFASCCVMSSQISVGAASSSAVHMVIRA
jgi:hypothetical protein